MDTCREAQAPSTVEDDVDKEKFGLFRRAVGQLYWQACIRPDIAFAVEESARPLNRPVEEDIQEALAPSDVREGIFAPQDGATTLRHTPSTVRPGDCSSSVCGRQFERVPSTRKRTPGALPLLFDCPIHVVTKTKGVFAFAEKELRFFMRYHACRRPSCWASSTPPWRRMEGNRDRLRHHHEDTMHTASVCVHAGAIPEGA